MERPAVLVAAGGLGSAVLVQDCSVEAFCEPSVWCGVSLLRLKGRALRTCKGRRGAELHCRHRGSSCPCPLCSTHRACWELLGFKTHPCLFF